MDLFYQISAALLCGYLLYRLFGFIKNNPSEFTLAKLNQGMMTMGILALILIAGIYFLVLLLKSG